MEKKTKYRILGILILVALIIVLLPLFLTGREEQQPDVAVINTPPFPEQGVQIPGNSEKVLDQSADQITKNEEEPSTNITEDNPLGPSIAAPKQQSTDLPPNVVLNSNNNMTPSETEKSETNKLSPSLSKDTKSQVSIPDAPIVDKIEEKPIAKNEKIIMENKSKKQMVDNKISSINHNEHQTLNKDVQKKALASNKKEGLDKNGLIDLKKPAWVIQIGSFKNKTNAIRLVNRLRTNGYSAFVQHVNNAAFGETIRVYVGPEEKPESAHEIANRMEKELHIAGIVISYKPLSL